jgi:SagB-type dehydrogenase family enzyme
MSEKINSENVGEAFVELTKYHRNYMAPHITSKEREPQYKEYRDVKQYVLPTPNTKNMTPAFESIIHRRSIRDYTAEELKPHHLSKILWAAQGITGKVKGTELRAVGSAGALHPIETYVVINRAGDLPHGLYHYNVRAHSLDLLIQDQFQTGLVNACMGQEFIGQAPVCFIWTGVFNRVSWRFAQRAYRYVYLECGQILQNATIACQAMDIGCCEIGAFYDDEINLLLGLEGTEETAICIMSAGVAKSTAMPITTEVIPEKVKVEKLS